MLVLVTYDVSTETPAGRKRLRRVAKSCVDCGQFAAFKSKLSALINPEEDSLRFYQMGNHYSNTVEHIGKHPDFQQGDVLIL